MQWGRENQACGRMEHVNTFAGGTHDRRNNERDARGDAWLDDDAALYLFFSNTKDLKLITRTVDEDTACKRSIEVSRAGLHIALFAKSEARDALMIKAREIEAQFPRLFLGVDSSERPLCAAALPDLMDEESGVRKHVRCVFADVQIADLRASASSVGPSLTLEHAALASHGRSLMEFHRRHRFCGHCGSQTVSQHGGGRRICMNHPEYAEREPTRAHPVCDGMVFPRSDPVVIAAVLNADRSHVLVGRGKRFPKGMYSVLAGFMEHGESVEDAVRREVFEESGIRVGRVEYDSSQPWPFPYSLMIGCIAYVAENVPHAEHITLDVTELDDAQWIPVSSLQALLEQAARTPAAELAASAASLWLPPPSAIANRLIQRAAQIASSTTPRSQQ